MSLQERYMGTSCNHLHPLFVWVRTMTVAEMITSAAFVGWTLCQVC
jgi:hypothetical protein